MVSRFQASKAQTSCEARRRREADGASAGEDVKIAVQLFKVKESAQNVQSFELSDDERLELEQLISITK